MFFCIECEQKWSFGQQFDGRPVCISCATGNGLVEVLNKERKHLDIRSKGDMLENIEFQVLDLDKSEISLVDAAREYNDYSGDIKITDADWVDLPGGVYAMGSPVTEEGRIGDESLHSITINRFKMMAKAVTFDQYDQFCKATARKLLFDKGWGRGARPVINVSYWDAVDFAEWLSTQIGWACRMPTEAEWEYACRAGGSSAFNTGEGISCGQANYDGMYIYGDAERGISRWKTMPVGSFPPNAWGLYDMHGNVNEWCASEYAHGYSGLEMMDASFDRENDVPRSLRGGSWLSRPAFLRSASRYRFRPDESGHDWGFRLVCSV